MKIKSFIEKQHINLIYGLNFFLFVTLFDRYSFIFSGIGNNYSVSKNELIILELLFLFINFVVLFCLYRKYKKKFKMTILCLYIIDIILFSTIVINGIYMLSTRCLTIINDISFFIFTLYLILFYFLWWFFESRMG